MFGQGCTVHISIHAPHEGERHAVPVAVVVPSVFQSTLPTRGSDNDSFAEMRPTEISIHAPHEGERLVIFINSLIK